MEEIVSAPAGRGRPDTADSVDPGGTGMESVAGVESDAAAMSVETESAGTATA